MKCRGVVHTNPAVSAAQYGMAQAVLSGQVLRCLWSSGAESGGL